MKYSLGERLVCIVVNLPKYAPCEVVNISEISNDGDDVKYKFKGYNSWHNEEYVDDNFRRY